MMQNGEDPNGLLKVGPLIAHTHIAEKDKRTAPGAMGDDFRPFFRAYKAIGYEGRISSSGFCDSSRIVTVFAYLTSVPPGGGGETRFNRLGGLAIRPVRGMAVVHLPGRLDCSRDDRVEHEGCAAGDRAKWVLVCQCWADPKDEATPGERVGGHLDVEVSELDNAALTAEL